MRKRRLRARRDGANDRADEPPLLRRRASFSGAALAATGSLLLLAVSNHITQNIAAIPLLWIVPLAIYLLTFILCFDGMRLVPPRALPARRSPRRSA